MTDLMMPSPLPEDEDLPFGGEMRNVPGFLETIGRQVAADVDAAMERKDALIADLESRLHFGLDADNSNNKWVLTSKARQLKRD